MDSRSRYSAKVSLALIVGGKTVPLSHVGPNEISVRNLGDPIAPTYGQILIEVDKSTKTLDVFLPNGISRDSYEVAFF
jgi:hypothetical protein